MEPEEKGASNIGLKEIFGVQESYKLPEIIMDTLLSDQAEDIIRKIKNEDIDIRDTFQEEQGDRKELKQDFTPDCICNLVAKLTEKGNCIDMCSGTGVLSKAVAKEHGTQVEEYEYSTRTIPFALLDACVNGLEGNISHADCLRNAAWETYAVKQVGDISIPKKTEKREMGMYDNVIMNPPYSMKFPDAEEYQIMGFTIPKAKADYGFLLRGIERMKGRLIATWCTFSRSRRREDKGTSDKEQADQRGNWFAGQIISKHKHPSLLGDYRKGITRYFIHRCK